MENTQEPTTKEIERPIQKILEHIEDAMFHLQNSKTILPHEKQTISNLIIETQKQVLNVLVRVAQS